MSDFLTAEQAREKAQAKAREDAQRRAHEQEAKRLVEKLRIADLVPIYTGRISAAVAEGLYQAVEGGRRAFKYDNTRWPASDYEAVSRAAASVANDLRELGYKVDDRTHYASQTRDSDDGMEFGPYVVVLLEVSW